MIKKKKKSKQSCTQKGCEELSNYWTEAILRSVDTSLWYILVNNFVVSEACLMFSSGKKSRYLSPAIVWVIIFIGGVSSVWEWDLNECLCVEKQFCCSNLKYMRFQKPVRGGILKYFSFLYKSSMKRHLCVRDSKKVQFHCKLVFFIFNHKIKGLLDQSF